MSSLTERISPEAVQALQTYLSILRKWNTAINLVSPSTLDQIWDRHFLDSAQVYFASGSAGGHWVDMGSGAGFPGLVIAILLKEATAEGRMTLIEADARKAAFLSTVIRELDLPCKVLVERIEAAPPQNADWLTARALAPLDMLLGFASRHLARTGVALLPKGRTYRLELESAKREWSFALDTLSSLSDPEGVVLRIRDVGRKS